MTIGRTTKAVKGTCSTTGKREDVPGSRSIQERLLRV